MHEAAGIALRAARLLALGSLALSAAACAGTVPQVASAPPVPIKKGWDGTIKIGKPYQIAGVWYYPDDDPTFAEEGVASWYGDQFHLRPTANGETFDMNEISAAHRTLPMPSYVEVTNLANGRQLVVRVNDRGPFRASRVIDLSRRAAQLLGFAEQGTAPVRVRRVFPENAPEVRLAARPDRMPVDLPTSMLPPAVPAAEIASAPLAPVPRQGAAPALAPVATAAAPLVTAGPAVNPAPMLANAFYIQLAAVGDQDRAKVLAADVRQFGSIAIEPFQTQLGTLYRVRVGPFMTREAADTMLALIRNAGYQDARVLAPTPAVG